MQKKKKKFKEKKKKRNAKLILWIFQLNWSNSHGKMQFQSDGFYPCLLLNIQNILKSKGIRGDTNTFKTDHYFSEAQRYLRIEKQCT